MHASLFRATPTGIVRRQCAQPVRHFGCTIRAYPAHAKELGNANPDSVHFFNKPATAAWQLHNGGFVPIPTRFGSVHHEIEIVLLIGATPLPAVFAPGGGGGGVAEFDPLAIKRSIEGIGLGIDWTLRDLQQTLAKGGLPWERAKSFERSAALTEFVDLAAAPDAGNVLLHDVAPGAFPRLQFALERNGTAVQRGDTNDLQFCPLRQVWEMHKVKRLQHGDVVMTGTPTGVGPAAVGDKLRLMCEQLGIDVSVTVTDEAAAMSRL
jgi:2-keto-4-pentenoate hydratase/2-oxohepta-3-ene-1,7-dioic acid hydratase in catechol pathway